MNSELSDIAKGRTPRCSKESGRFRIIRMNGPAEIDAETMGLVSFFLLERNDDLDD